jgi:hypothetical protein
MISGPPKPARTLPLATADLALEPAVPDRNVLSHLALADLPAQWFASPSLPIRPWADDVIDTLGHDPRSIYVEQFWLGILGPSTTWLLRRIAASFEVHPEGFPLALAETAREIGLGDKGGRHSPFVRAVVRCCQFDLARPAADGAAGLEVRRFLPPLNRRQVVRLPDRLREAHDAWQRSQLGPPRPEAVQHRARQLALSLIELGEDGGAVERQLLRWRFHPALARQAATWAWDRHRLAREAVASTSATSPVAGMSGPAG